MPTPAYVPIANITLGSNASTVTFSNISQEYADLVLVTRHSHSGDYGLLGMRFNSDSGSNYANIVLSGLSWASPNTGSSSGTSVATINVTGVGANTYLTSTTNIFDYSRTDKYKSTLSRFTGFSSDQWTSTQSNTWSSTNAITSITLGNWSGTYTQGFSAGSTFALYGIVA